MLIKRKEWPLQQEAESTQTTGTAETSQSQPATEATESTSNAPTESGDGVDWLAESDLGNENDGDGQQTATTATKAEAAKPASEPAAAKPATEAKPAATEPAKPAAEPAKPAATEPAKPVAAAAETPEAKAAREKAEVAERTKVEEEAFKKLTEFYKIPEDMAAKLATEPENVLPFLAAQVHRNVMQGVMSLVAQQLPAYLTMHNTVSTREAADKKAFYDTWPQLAQYEQQVLAAGRMYRELNKTADQPTAIKAIGKIVCDSLGLPASMAGEVGAAATAAAPAAAATTSFQPAGVGGSRSAAPATQKNEWEEMSAPD